MTSQFTEPDADQNIDPNAEPEQGEFAEAESAPIEDDDPTAPRRTMQPRDRWLRVGHPPQAIPIRRDEFDEWGEATRDKVTRSTRQDLDPAFGYIMVMALSVGLTPIDANLRYVVLWTLMAGMGGIAFLMGSGIRLKVTDPGDLLWGVALGLFTGGALMMVGSDTLTTASERLFNAGHPSSALIDTWVFQATVFGMPIAESLFFRGAMQRVYPLPTVALLASLWSMLMFFPSLDLGDAPVVGVVFGTALVMLNFLYSYVNSRHGLAASFFCQIIAGTLILLVPRLITF